MRLIERLRRLDDKFIDALQDAYLWFYDRTGTYLGTCCAALFVIDAVIRRNSFVEIAGDAALLFLSSQLYQQQRRGLFGQINDCARLFRSSALRRCYLWLMAVCVVWPPVDRSSISAFLLTLAVGYGRAIQIRDRQRKDLFAWLRQPKSAGAAA